MRSFGTYPPIPTLEESYDNGYLTGVLWNAAHPNPVGPIVPPTDQETNPAWAARCYAMQGNNRAWHHGFKDAMESKKEHK